MSGKAALEFLQTNRPDLILLDIKMPEMDGFEVMAHLQEDEKLRDIPIIFLSADSMHKWRASVLNVEHWIILSSRLFLQSCVQEWPVC